MKKLLAFAAVAALAGIARAEDKIDFARQIRPIFAETCYKCHNEKKHKGDLRLDSADAILKGGKDGKILAAGDPGKSDLFKRIMLPKDDDDVMPPEGDPLPKAKTDLIKQWIAQGASFGDWKSDAGGGAAATATADKGEAAGTAIPEPQLPQVAAADAGAIDKIRQSGALAMPLAQNTNLLEVDLNLVGDHIDNAQLDSLQPLSKQLFALNLARTKVTDDGLKDLEGLSNLRRLHLENTKVSDAGLAHLKGLSNLEYLNLYGTQVTDAGLAELAGLKNLKSLYLWQTKVTPAGVERLKQALPKCEINTGWEQTASAASATKVVDKVAAKPLEKVITYKGTIKDGKIVLDGETKLPEGAAVEVTVKTEPAK